MATVRMKITAVYAYRVLEKYMTKEDAETIAVLLMQGRTDGLLTRWLIGGSIAFTAFVFAVVIFLLR